jgi:subtilisin family serine protease
MKTFSGMTVGALFAWNAILSLMLCTSGASLAQAEQVLKAFPNEYVVTLPVSTAARSLHQGNSLTTSKSGSGRIKSAINETTLVLQRGASTATLSFTSEEALTSPLPIDLTDTFCAELIASRQVASCSPNYEMRAGAVTPNDPDFGQLWGLSSARGIDAPRAWELSTGSNDVVVAVIDTGVDYNHPDLNENMWRNTGEVAANGVDDDGNGIIDDVFGYNAMAENGNPMDDNLHGTHCAGTIGAVGNNRNGVVGVNHRVKLMALKFLDNKGSGSLSNAIKAIDYAVTMKRKHNIARLVLSNSWGGGGYSQALYDAIDRARAAGILFVAAAGNEANDNDSSPAYPGSYDISNVVSVAAIDRDGNLAGFSNYGTTTVDIAAPGVSIYSTAPNGGYATLSGTSMATPHVSGALALLWGYDASFSVEALLKRLYESGRTLSTLKDSNTGVSLVRTQRALDVGRLLYDEIAPLPSSGETVPPCGYDFTTANVLTSGQVDTAADTQTIINQADEGSFYAVPLKFEFPFFRGSTSVIYLSPNGVVYAKAPSALDYQVSGSAPLNSIAALHTDLTPTKAHHGIRVYSGPDKVTVAWVDEQYNTQGQGDIFTRLTLYPNGTVQSSVSFGSAGELVTLRKAILGDPFATTPTPPRALIGATGPSAPFTSTVDLAAAQRSLMTTGAESFVLGVTMVPNCSKGGSGGPSASVNKISLKQSSLLQQARSKSPKLTATLAGTGTGQIALTVAINGVQCQQQGAINLVNGSARFAARLPRTPVRVRFTASGVSKTLKMKSLRSSQAVSPAKAQRMCNMLVSSITKQ